MNLIISNQHSGENSICFILSSDLHFNRNFHKCKIYSNWFLSDTRKQILESFFYKFNLNSCISFKGTISFSDIPVPYLTHIDIVDAGLEVLEQDQIKSATVESLRFMNNKIKIIDNNMFAWVCLSFYSIRLPIVLWIVKLGWSFILIGVIIKTLAGQANSTDSDVWLGSQWPVSVW